MQNRNHSEKEIQIYQALLSLIRRGSPLSAIRVEDIAREAGIGKGTVYEYVKSKRELIREALLFEMERQVSGMAEKISQAVGFYEKFNAAYRYLIQEIRDKLDIFKTLFSLDWFEELIDSMSSEREQCVRRLYEVMDELIETGVEDGILSRQEDIEYQHFVIAGLYTASFARFCFFKKGITKQQETAEVDFAYRTLVSSLSGSDK